LNLASVERKNRKKRSIGLNNQGSGKEMGREEKSGRCGGREGPERT